MGEERLTEAQLQELERMIADDVTSNGTFTHLWGWAAIAPLFTEIHALAARLAEVEGEKVAYFDDLSSLTTLLMDAGIDVQAGKTVDQVGRVLGRLAEVEGENQRLTRALAAVEFENVILPGGVCEQDRCVCCDAMRYQGHAQGCRIAAALGTKGANDGRD